MKHWDLMHVFFDAQMPMGWYLLESVGNGEKKTLETRCEGQSNTLQLNIPEHEDVAILSRPLFDCLRIHETFKQLLPGVLARKSPCFSQR